MSKQKALYLLRFDDLCPTMSLDGWRRFEALFSRWNLKPILAVVPHNLDPELEQDSTDENFWPAMQRLVALGAVIGLHGLHHICNQRGKSLFPLHNLSEFSGLSIEQQRQMLRKGLELLRAKALNPRLFVAPRHAFDRATLQALKLEAIPLLSDGFAARPFLRDDLTWLPQQIWAPIEKDSGVWTICIHSNNFSNLQFARLEEFIAQHAAQFVSLDEALTIYPPTTLNPFEQLAASLRLTRIRLSKAKKRFLAHRK